MRVGIVSDVHGNAAALEATLAALGAVDALWFAGDLLGYYFDARAVMDRLRDAGATCILGNHDVYFLAHLGYAVDASVKVPPADAYRRKYGPSLERAARELSSDDVAWLQALPTHREMVVEGKRVLLTHGSPWRPVDEYVYPDFPEFERFASLPYDLVVMGHTHRPVLRTEGAVTLLNPGSCGQPRDFDPRAAFAEARIDAVGIACNLHRTEYDRAPLFARCRELAPDVPLLTELLARGDRTS